MDYVLIGFLAQIAVFYILIVAFEFFKSHTTVSLIGFKKTKKAEQEQIWRKAS